ncbi:DUF2484 family protein [Albidovulum sp.]|jgi:hypothetical protein|uniref:DUF2484 family protein n=1 Tax=Albidovulum sp. TaxID=1872424 RepID=UPI0030689A07
MSTPLLLAFLWVVAATVVAFLPMRLQFVFGFFLALSALALIVWLSVSLSPWIGVAALAGFVSMFRKPLGYFAKRLMGKGVAK